MMLRCVNWNAQATGAAQGLQALHLHLPAWAEALQRMPAGGTAAFAAPLLRAPASGLLVQVGPAAFLQSSRGF